MAEVTGEVSAKEVGRAHSKGFDAALDAALEQASQTIGRGTFRVSVEFWAEIEVTNPGQVQTYGVTMTQG